jgi:prepilin-type N-terminal cleavage/methylation domain-containing protein
VEDGKSNARRWKAAFTLIEVMVVVGIMTVVMTMGVPMVYRIWHKEPMRKALSDVEEVLSNARARAIMSGSMAEVVFYPQEKRFEVSGGGRGGESVRPAAGVMSAGDVAGSGLSGQFSDDVAIDMLDINLFEYRDEEVAHVHFYPNGTCDEMTLVLRDSTGQRGVTLEITTGLATILNDKELWDLRNGKL